jgi:tetratricopeptide (TPR) repeat protein
VDLYDLILERYPDDGRAANNRGVMFGSWLNDPEEAYRAVLRALELDPGSAFYLDNAIRGAFFVGRIDETERLVRTAEEEGHEWVVSSWRVARAIALGELEEWTTLCDAILADPPGAAGFSGARDRCASMDVAAGRLELGETRMAPFARHHEELGAHHRVANASVVLAAARSFRGDTDGARAILSDVPDRVPVPTIPEEDRHIIRTNLGVAAALLGHPDLIERFRAAYGPPPEHWFGRMGGALLRAAEALGARDPRAALAILEDELPGDRMPSGWLIWNELLRGFALQAVGEVDAAAVHFERAAEPGWAAIHASSNYRIFLPMALRGLAESHEARGDREAAADAYRRLLELRAGADPDLAGELEELRAALARLEGEGPP